MLTSPFVQLSEDPRYRVLLILGHNVIPGGTGGTLVPVPVSAAFTFSIVPSSAPKERKRPTIALIWDWVSVASSAIPTLPDKRTKARNIGINAFFIKNSAFFSRKAGAGYYSLLSISITTTSFLPHLLRI